LAIFFKIFIAGFTSLNIRLSLIYPFRHAATSRKTTQGAKINGFKSRVAQKTVFIVHGEKTDDGVN
jgi:hypothetical protein